jgi:hypothetical protein
MAKNINQGFQEFRSRLEITDLQASVVSKRQQGIREAIENEFTVLDHFLTGSYKRNTLIAPLKKADIDIFFILDDQYKKGGQSYILDRVRNILKQAYRETSDISRDGQAVTIFFNDFQIDVVPAFYRRLLSIPIGGYIIPNTITRSWIPTNPQKHIELWSRRNEANNGNLVPLIKMIKAWNQVHGKLLTSFHLECLILKIMKYETIRNFPSAIRIVFENAKESFQHVHDPIMDISVSSYLDTQEKVNTIADQLQLAYGRAKNAEVWVKKGNMEDAFYYWGKLFGQYFPVYG